MIDANELRIGNWIQRLDGSYFQVKASDILNLSSWKSEYLKPQSIPLTEEILLKIKGMELDEYNSQKTYSLNLSINDSMVGIGFEDADLFIFEENGKFRVCDIYLEYLHDLQNYAYYKLGKKELEIDL